MKEELGKDTEDGEPKEEEEDIPDEEEAEREEWKGVENSGDGG